MKTRIITSIFGLILLAIVLCLFNTPVFEIVVALIEDEATVKRFYKDKDCFRLMPENDAFEPIIVPELAILGKVVSLIRNY